MFSFEKDQERESEISRIVGSQEFRNYIRSAIEALPEYRATKEIAEKFEETMAIKYALFVGVNDRRLTWVHYKDYKGSEALWYAPKDALIELGMFDVNKLTRRVLEKLHLSSGKRRIHFEKLSSAIGSDQVLALINDWIQSRVIGEDSLRRVLEPSRMRLEVKSQLIKVSIQSTYRLFGEADPVPPAKATARTIRGLILGPSPN